MKLEDKIKSILREYPNTRNNDTALEKCYICKYYPEMIIYIDDTWYYTKELIDKIKFSAIERVRRDIQSGEYLKLKQDLLNGSIEKIDYTKTLYMPIELKVLHKRRMLCEEMKNHYRK